MATSLPYAGCDPVAARAIMPAASSTAVDPAQVMAWRLPSRALAIVAFLGVALLQGHTRADAGAQRARWNDAALAAAAGPLRALEPRLTGGFAYAPWTSRTPASAPPRASSHLLAVAARIEQAAHDRRPADLRAFGVATVLIGRPDEAIEPLERALAAAPDDPRILSDLAAVLLARSTEPEDTLDALRALDHAERAWRMAPSLPEAVFNAALARERLHLRAEARQAWHAYQRLDPASGWSAEAGRHDAALSADRVAAIWPRVRRTLLERIAAGAPLDADTLARSYPQPLREFLQEELMPAWGGAYLAGDATASTRRRTAAHAVCSALAARGDATCLRTVARLDDTTPTTAVSLAAGYDAFGRAMTAYRNHAIEAARPLFEAAKSRFLAASVPDRLWCDVYLGVIEYRAGAYTALTERLLAARTDTTDGDLTLRGRIAWGLGLGYLARERFADALAQYAAARAAFLAAREGENVGRMDLLTAEALARLGSVRSAWRHFDQALAGLDDGHNLTARQTILIGATNEGLQENFVDAALAFRDEFFADGLPAEAPVARVEALLYYFAILSRLGDVPRAREAVALARRTLEGVTDLGMRRRLEGEIALQEGRTDVDVAPVRAIPFLTASLDRFHALNFDDRVPEIFALRGRAHQRTGDLAAARRDYQSGLAALDARMRKIGEEALRLSALEPAEPLFTSLIGLDLAERRPMDALATAERHKSETLGNPGLTCASGDTPDPSACWTRTLSPGMTALSYVVLEDRLAIWAWTSSTMSHVIHPISAPRLRALVEEFRDAMQDPRVSASRIRALSVDLFDQLIRPVADRIAPETDLVIMPDDVLHALPFAALFDARQQRYLMEDHVLLMSPSYSHYLAATRRQSALAAPQVSRALVVTNPTTVGLVSAGLPRLPGADAEARHLASLFRHVEVLRAEQATKSRVIRALGRAQVLHLAGHARVNFRTPWESYFLLASDAREAGEELLLMSDLARLPLGQLRLAVLAACGSAEGPLTAGGTALSLAQPFLAAGVPMVAASLWSVGDRATADLFRVFYSRLSEGAPAARALRDAQVSILRAGHGGLPTPPGSWAAFIVIGGHQSGNGQHRGTS